MIPSPRNHCTSQPELFVLSLKREHKGFDLKKREVISSIYFGFNSIHLVFVSLSLLIESGKRMKSTNYIYWIFSFYGLNLNIRSKTEQIYQYKYQDWFDPLCYLATCSSFGPYHQ